MSDDGPAMPAHRMPADAFLAWAEGEEGHHELHDGLAVRLAPECVAHVLAKGRVFRVIHESILAARLPCEGFPKGVAVEVDDANVHSPDVLVRCGHRLPGDALKVTDPIIVVEIRTPWDRDHDAGSRFADIFRIPTVRHYLQILTDRRLVLHHARPEGAAKVETAILPGGPLRLDPPGLDLDLDAFFART